MSEDWQILALTVSAALTSTVLIIPWGVGAAWALSRWRGVGRTWVETLFSLPLVLPPSAVGLLLLQALGQHGPIGRLLHILGVEVLFTWKAVVIAAATMSFPLLVRTARTSFEEVEPRLLGMARTLGAGPWGAFCRVALPLAGRGIVAGSLLAFARALGEFGATILVAGNIPGRTQTLSLAIFHRTQLGRDGEALRLVAWSTGLAFLAIWCTEVLARRRARRLSA